MFAKKHVCQGTMFVAGNISDFVREDHILKRVNNVLDLSWLDAEVKGLYSEDVGGKREKGTGKKGRDRTGPLSAPFNKEK